METSALVATIDLIIKTDQESAKTKSENRITGSCLSIFRSNGTIKIQKYQKSKMSKIQDIAGNASEKCWLLQM